MCPRPTAEPCSATGTLQQLHALKPHKTAVLRECVKGQLQHTQCRNAPRVLASGKELICAFEQTRGESTLQFQLFRQRRTLRSSLTLLVACSALGAPLAAGAWSLWSPPRTRRLRVRISSLRHSYANGQSESPQLQ